MRYHHLVGLGVKGLIKGPAAAFRLSLQRKHMGAVCIWLVTGLPLAPVRQVVHQGKSYKALQQQVSRLLGGLANADGNGWGWAGSSISWGIWMEPVCTPLLYCSIVDGPY